MKGVAGVGYKEDGKLVFNLPRALKPIQRVAAQGIPSGRFRCVRAGVRAPLGDVYVEPRVPLQLRVLHQRRRIRPQVERARTGAGGGGDERTGERYGLSLLWIVDDNFLVDRERAIGIAEGLVRRGVKFDWSIQSSTNLVSRFSVDELKLLRRAGLSQVSQGADSGSVKVMHLMNKDFQKIETIYTAADKLSQAGIRPSFNMIFGFPGEGESERRESIALIMDVCRKFPGAEFWTNIFTPYPGSPIMQRAFELGIHVPKTLEGWSDFFPRYTVLPWLNGRKHREVQTMREYLRIAFNRVPIGIQRKNTLSAWSTG